MTRNQQRDKQSAAAEPAGNEVREALSAAGKVFDEMALERPLPPYAEWARDLLLEAQGNPVEHVEMFSGPHLEYSWFAKVTRDPTPKGLDGGRVLFFDLVKPAESPTSKAPDLGDADKYEQWLKDLPDQNMHVARYENGKLTRYVDSPETDALIAEIKQTCAAWEIDRAAGARSVDQALSAAREALDNLAMEQGLSPDAERARDLCSGALENIEQSRADSDGREGGAIARAIEKVKTKEQEERQRGDRDQDRDRDR